MLKQGETAPDFTAVTTSGDTVSLHDYLGKNNVVLFFYPEDDTSGCTREACGFRDAMAEYDQANTVVFGVSTDTQASHQAFTQKYSLNFPLLVDTDRSICQAYDVPVNGHQPQRVTFLIGTDGIIARMWDQVNTATHAVDVLGEIASLDH